ncbi:sugar ABC transporter substrate-binding protein [Aporhodopirellula aestuarii]|uniref:Sugar ABC transporter substrate-binding protein n=1 Tax=Aporhodopirellula aestuarii TaxID=2950107 RepID=A0ABT0TY09_9BACT|nr:sugar ABC transporter substrate-binding protein [Aporhodopirellula aestuarii]MCM2369469.1 sugar ABC transporter substrate-binding protein [Aporhodopirellula aestuarii]
MQRVNRISIAAGLVCFCLLIGCKASTTTDEPTSESSEKPKVALIMKSLANEFFSTMAKGAETHHQQSGQYELVVNGIKDERDVSRQVALVQEMVASDVDVIVIAPADSQALIPSLRRAIKAGIIVVNIDNKLDAEMLRKEGLQIPFVGPDNRAGAKQVGDYLATHLAEGDSVAILEGLQTSENGRARKAGFEEAMNEAGVKIVDSQSAEWEMAKANEIASSMLSEHTEIKAILAANDSMALGAVAAAKSVGRSDDLSIVGFDNIAAVRTAIRDGKVLATADQYGDQLAVYGIETGLKLIADENAEVADVETPVDLITKETLDAK